MQGIQSLGKWMFALPMLLFGILHFGPLEYSLPYIPSWLPFPAFWVYFAGVGLILFAVSFLLGRKDRLAALLLALELLLFVVLIHIPKLLEGDFLGLIATFRDTAMAGAALMFAEAFARDRSLLGESKTVKPKLHDD